MRKQAHNKMMTLEMEQRIVELYGEGKSGTEILEIIGTFKTTKTIYDILRKYNVDPRTGTKRDPLLDHFYFHDIDSPEKAYALGLILSDGWVTKPQKDSSGNITRNAQIALMLEQTDGYLVEWMKSQWGTANKINTITNKPNEDDPSRTVTTVSKRIVVTSPQMFFDLDSLGIDARKSYVSILPIIDDDLYPFFCRGLFDGDGTLGEYNYMNETKLPVRWIGSLSLVGQLAWYFHHRLGVDYVKPSWSTHTKTLGTLTYTLDEQTKKICDFIYGDLDAAPYMKRKYEKYENYFG